MMQLSGVLIILFLIGYSSAGSDFISSFRIDGKDQKFVSIPQERLTISASCQKPNGKFDCDAYRALKRAVRPSKKRQTNGNPGALVCHHLNGAVVWGTDKKKPKHLLSV